MVALLETNGRTDIMNTNQYDGTTTIVYMYVYLNTPTGLCIGQ